MLNWQDHLFLKMLVEFKIISISNKMSNFLNLYCNPISMEIITFLSSISNMSFNLNKISNQFFFQTFQQALRISRIRLTRLQVVMTKGKTVGSMMFTISMEMELRMTITRQFQMLRVWSRQCLMKPGASQTGKRKKHQLQG